MTAPYSPVGLSNVDGSDGFERVADHLAHNAAATAIVIAGLSRQIERGQISRDQILSVLDSVSEEATAAHSLAARVFGAASLQG